MVDKTKNQIEKAMDAVEKALDIEPLGEEIQFEKNVTFDGFEIQEDGSAEIAGEQPIDQSQIPFDANLAEYIDDDKLTKFATDLVDNFEGDKESRKDWEDTYIKGLDMLGFKYEDRTQPFEGASGVVHPLLAESVTQFQAQAYKELLPPSGPVRTQIVGEATPMIEQQAERVKEYMNYYILNVMEEYDPEMDQLLFYLPLSGSAFKKVYYDPILQRAVSKFVTSEDCVVNYMATDLESAERITHCIKMTNNEVRKLQVSGFYKDIELPSGEVDPSEVREKSMI